MLEIVNNRCNPSREEWTPEHEEVPTFLLSHVVLRSTRGSLLILAYETTQF